MKTPEQWERELNRCIGTVAIQNCIKEIQQDAYLAGLSKASEIAKYRTAFATNEAILAEMDRVKAK